MKKSWEFWNKNWFKLIYLSCFAAGALVMSDSVWNMGWSHGKILLLVPAILFFLCWAEEKRLWFQVWGGLGLLHGLAGIFWYRQKEDRAVFLEFLELEAICLAVCILLWLCRKNRVAFYAVSMLQFLALILAVPAKVEAPVWAVCLLLLCQLLFVTELVQKKEGDAARTAGHLFPVFVVAVLLLAILPVRAEPIRWETVKKAVRMAQEKLEDLGLSAKYFFAEDSTYGLTFAGYGSEGKLGGSLFSSDQLQISIEGRKTNSPLYLAGTVYDTYTGTGWERNFKEKPYGGKEYSLRHKEMVAALSNSNIDPEEQDRLTQYRTCQIRYEGLKTSSLFLVPVTQQLMLPQNAVLSEEKADSPVLEKAQTVGFTYEIRYMEVDYAAQQMKKLLRQQAWAEDAVFDQTLEGRERFIRENYLTLPENLPDRVYDLAAEITAGEDTDYDKLKSIEKFLSGYAYSTQPKACPQDRDFTDFFLYESDSGYCTYFATAMAVLGRCSQIPTRYVEGFVTAKSREGKEKTLSLTGSDAHAWVEAYIEHVGWVPFDPTPGYRELSDTPWNVPQKAQVSGNRAGGEKPGGEEKPKEKETAGPVQETETEKGFMENGREMAAVFAETAGILLMLLLVLAAGTGMKYVYRKKKYEACPDDRKMVLLMKKVLEINGLYGFTMEQGETLEAFAVRVGQTPDTTVRSFREICRLYAKARFGGGARAGDVNEMQAYVKALEKKYLSECGWIRRLVYRLR